MFNSMHPLTPRTCLAAALAALGLALAACRTSEPAIAAPAPAGSNWLGQPPHLVHRVIGAHDVMVAHGDRSFVFLWIARDDAAADGAVAAAPSGRIARCVLEVRASAPSDREQLRIDAVSTRGRAGACERHYPALAAALPTP